MKAGWPRVALFFLLTVGITRGLVALSRRLGLPAGSAGYWVVRHAFMLVPGLVALCLLLLWREPVRQALGLKWTPNRWWIVAWLLPAVVVLVQIALTTLLVPGAMYRPPVSGPVTLLPLPPLVAAIVLALMAGPTVLILGSIGEEVAWRGFLHRELGRKGFWLEALIVGLLWAAWHLPAVMDPIRLARAFPWPLMLWSPVILWLRLRGGAVWPAVLLHGTMNTAGHLPGLFIRGGNSTMKALVSGGLLLACLALIAWARPREVPQEPS